MEIWLTKPLINRNKQKIIGCDLPLEEIMNNTNNTSNKQNNNIFEQTVKTLTKDAVLLQEKFHKLQEADNIKCSIDTLRLLKDTLNLIKEYDWQVKYSEYRTEGHKEVAVWEQNHSGEIRNHKKWIVYEKDNDNNNALVNYPPPKGSGLPLNSSPD